MDRARDRRVGHRADHRELIAARPSAHGSIRRNRTLIVSIPDPPASIARPASLAPAEIVAGPASRRRRSDPSRRHRGGPGEREAHRERPVAERDRQPHRERREAALVRGASSRAVAALDPSLSTRPISSIRASARSSSRARSPTRTELPASAVIASSSRSNADIRCCSATARSPRRRPSPRRSPGPSIALLARELEHPPLERRRALDVAVILAELGLAALQVRHPHPRRLVAVHGQHLVAQDHLERRPDRRGHLTARARLSA